MATISKWDRVTTELKDAYQWEIDRIKDWSDNIKNKPLPPNNPLAKRFADTWLEYFDEVNTSNGSVKEICQNTLTAGAALAPPAQDNEAEKAIRKLDRNYLRRSVIFQLAQDAGDKGINSQYFESLAAALNLELDVRDYTVKYLRDG